MDFRIRASVLCALACVLASCATTEYKVANSATADGSILRALQIENADVKYQAPCVVAVKQLPRPRPLSCVYVQTAKDVYFLRFNQIESKYVPAVSMPISEVTSVALSRYGLNRQVQVRRKSEVLAFHIVGSAMVDSRMTEDIFASLVAMGVASAEPEKWIELMAPVPMTVTIPVYVGR